MSTYGYVGNNPIQSIDPRGLTGYISLTAYTTRLRFLAAGGGYSEVACKDNCGKAKVFRFLKLCGGVATGPGVSLVAGGVSNMEGKQCVATSYEGYFFELSAGAMTAAGGMDFGMTQNRYHIPNGWSPVNEAGVGAGSPGMAGLLCYYWLIDQN
jgi:hypothetical protein